MANRWFNQFGKTLAKEVVSLYAQVSFGASGAPTLVTTGTNSTKTSQGIKSISQNGTGDYTITLQDPYYQLLWFGVAWDESSNSGSAPLAYSQSWVKARTVGTTSGGTIEFVTGGAAGAATNPASGEIALIEIVVQNSNAV